MYVWLTSVHEYLPIGYVVTVGSTQQWRTSSDDGAIKF